MCWPTACSRTALQVVLMLLRQLTYTWAVQQLCPYGSLPGVWQSNATVGSKWTLLAPECQLRPLVGQYLNGSHDIPSVDHRRLLFLSDSVDYKLVIWLCPQSKGGSLLSSPLYNNHTLDKYGWHSFNSCYNASGLDIGQVFIPGVIPNGKYWENVTGGWPERIKLADEQWSQHIDGKPDLIVVASNFWDMGKWAVEPNLVPLGLSLELPVSYLNDWMNLFTQQITYIRSLFGEGIPLAIHTSAPATHSHKDGLLRVKYPARKSHMVQLNAAAKEVARRLELPYVDLAAICEKYPTASTDTYLADGHHPKAEILFEGLNIYLNIMDQLRRR